MSTLYPVELGIVEFTMPFKSKETKVFAPVAAPPVTMVIVPAEALAVTLAIVTVPEEGPLISPFRKLSVPAVAATAELTTKPAGKVSTILPPDGMEVLTGNSTAYAEAKPAARTDGLTRTGLIPCVPELCWGPLPGPSEPPVILEFATLPKAKLAAGVPVVRSALLDKSWTKLLTVTLKVFPFCKVRPVIFAVIV